MILSVWTWLLLAAGPCDAPAACRCAQPSIEQGYERSEAVFRGVVLEIGALQSEPLGESTVTPLPPDSNGMPQVTVTSGRTTLPVQPVSFRVARRWKGAAGETVVVGGTYLCGVRFEPGREYLVYASRDRHGRLVTSFCDRSRVMERDPRLVFQAGIDDVPELDRLAHPPGGSPARVIPNSRDCAVGSHSEGAKAQDVRPR